MLFPAGRKLFAPGAHALSSGKRTAAARKGRPIATFVIGFRRLRFHFPGKAVCGALRQGSDSADTTTGNLHIGNADSLDLTLLAGLDEPQRRWLIAS